MNGQTRDTLAITDLSAYRDNLRTVMGIIGPSVRLLAVVKGNAYGHGMTECARTALDTGASMLGVAYAMEGIRLRDEGITAPILVMGAETGEFVPEMVAHGLTVGTPSMDTLAVVKKAARAAGIPARIHVKVDAGMGRIGVRPDDAEKLLRDALGSPEIVVEGIYTHFPSADEDRDPESLKQIEVFTGLLDRLSAKGIRPPLAHMCNSAATIRFPRARLDMVRTGLVTYGLVPYPGSTVPIRPVLRLESRIAFVKEVSAGFAVSYGGTFVTKHPSRLATVPIGYADGYRRFLSNRGCAVVNGILVPIAGRVCMDQTVFDVTDAGNVRPGDRIVLIGSDGPARVTAEDLADIGGTITHEIVTGFTSRVSRAIIPVP